MIQRNDAFDGFAARDGSRDAVLPNAEFTVARAIRDGAARLEGIADNPRREARLLLAHAAGLSQNELLRDPARRIGTAVFHAHIARRVAREPLALIVGRREFWSLEFQVSPATLIPRPDSEAVVEAALAAFSFRSPPRRILDLGTGTGCLLLALLTEFPDAFGIGLDLQLAAAALARDNAQRLGLADRSAFVVADWTNPIVGRFDLIVSNPPYIRRDDIARLMPEVGQYEPRSALCGGADGYEAYRAIVPRLERHLELHGAAVLELGEGQAIYVSQVARDVGLEVSLRCDLAQIARAMVLTCPNHEKTVWQGA